MPHRTLNLTLASSLALTAAAALLATPAALAGTLSWDPGLTPLTPSGGDGTWDLSTTANWSNGVSDVQWTDTTGGTDTATFANTAGTVTLDTTLGARGLQFSTTGYSVTGSGTLTLGAGGIDAASLTSGTTTLGFSNLTLASGQSWNVGDGGTLAVNAAVAAHTTGVTLAINNSTSNGSGLYSSTSLANTNGILGPWASYGSVTSLKYATISSGTISGLTGTTAATAAALTDTTGTVNYDLASAAGTTPDTVSANTIRYTGGWQTLAPGATSFTINGLMNAGTGPLTVGPNPITIGANKELVILGNAQGITITSDIVDNGGGASAVTYNGGGTLTLTGAKSFTGGLFVTAGTVTGNNAGSFGTGTITLGGSGDATLGMPQATVTNAINLGANTGHTQTITGGGNGGATLTGAIALNGSDLTLSNAGGNSAGGITYTGGISGTGNLIFALTGGGNGTTIKTTAVDITGNITNQASFSSGGVTISSNITNAANIVQNSALQQMTISGTNLQTGKVSVLAGQLDFVNKVSLYNGDDMKWTPANIDVKSGATFMVGVGGSGLADADLAILLDGNHLGASTASTGLESGAFLGLDCSPAGYGTATFSGVIANPNGGANVLGVVSAGYPGTLVLSGLNTYTGATIITGIHTLSVSKLDNGGVASNIGASASDAANLVIGQAATLTYTGAGDSTDRLMTLGPTNAWGSVGPTINNNGTGALNFNNTGAVAFTGAVPGGSTQNFTLGGTNTGDNTFAPIITDNGTSPLSFIKAGAGKWILSGANTFTGKTSINGGILSVASLNSVNGGTASSSLGAPITIANGTIAIGSGATAATLLYTGAGETTDRVINLAGTTGGATIDQSGTGLLKFTSAFTATGGGNKTLTLQGFAAGTGEIAGAIVDNTAVTKITSLTKAGTGTWTLSGANSYTGATNVNGGTLLVNGSLASDSAVTVASTATLGGSGTIGGAVTVQAGGKLAPGTSPGQLTVGSLTLAVDSTTQMEIGGATLGTGYDNVTVTTAGGLTYGGLLDIVSYGIYNVAAQSGSYELFTFTGGYAGDFGTVTVNGFALANTAGVWSGTNGGITYTFTDSTGVLQVVPEPAALALLLIGGVGLLRRRRAG